MLLDAYRTWGRARDKAFTLLVARSFRQIGSRSVIRLPVRLKGEQYMQIGSGVTVAAGSWLQAIARAGEPPPLLCIGDDTSIAGSCVISVAREVRLGQAVLLAGQVYISDHDHSYADTTRPVMKQGLQGVAAVEIADGAWLGQNVVVCPGVRIGRGAVVGANSVVKDDVPDHCLAVGAPARVVRAFAAPPPEESIGAVALDRQA